jgi:hypothetical protein
MRDAMFEMRSSAVDVFAMRLQASVTFGTAHVLAAASKRLRNAHRDPLISVTNFAFINRLAHHWVMPSSNKNWQRNLDRVTHVANQTRVRPHNT